MAKPNMNPAKTPMPVLDPALRARTFDEVAVGYSDSDAQNEAARCLGCKNPACVGGCPVGINIPAFIAKIKENDTEGAYRVISIDSSLPAVCGRVCPQETQCEQKCTLGIKFEPVGIGRLERFVADYHNKNFKGIMHVPVSNGHKVATPPLPRRWSVPNPTVTASRW